MSKYNSRKEVPTKYKWDLTDFFKNEDEYNKTYDETLRRIDIQKKYKGKLKDSKTLYEFLKYDEITMCNVENLYIYAFLKDDEELGKKENINRKNKAVLIATEYSNAISFFNPEILSFSKEEFNN